MLLIEDNLDVITYLQACLIDTYQVEIALDGQTGIDKAIEIIPDIIITDIMMPNKDGFEVCESLKLDDNTCHIPIIMLTAKYGVDDKIKGLSKGADAYLSKPFHQEELNVRLEQLLKQRATLQAFYAQQSIQETEVIEIQAPIDPFIQKLIDFIHQDISLNMDLVTVCKGLSMSRAQVYRKTKALTGLSPSIYIRRIRLKHAYFLLETTHQSVAEVAYAVGFKDPFFFSTSFSEVYDFPPSKLKKG